MNIAIIGLGKMGNYHYKACEEMGHNMTLCDTRMQYFKEINGFKDYKNILKVHNIDKVIIASPTTTHFKIASYFISQGIDTFIEKPITVSSENAYYLEELAKQYDVQLMVGHIERFNPAVRDFTYALAKAPLKNIIDITTIRRGYRPDATSCIIGNVMIHDIDILRYLLNYDEIPFPMQSFIRGCTHAQSLLNYNDIPVAHQVDRLSHHVVREIRIATEKYYYVIDLFNKEVKIYDDVDKNVCFGKKTSDDALRRELKLFFEGYNNAASACKNVETVEKILERSKVWKK